MSANGNPGAAEPFAPPQDQDTGAAAPTVVVAAWAMAGAFLGTLAGGTLQLVGVLSSLVPVALGTSGALATVGLLAWMVDRRQAQDRPAVVDGSGRLTRPARSWLLAAPILLGFVGMAGLVVIASVRAGSLAPGVGFGLASLLLLWMLRPLGTNHVLAGAVEAASSGRVAVARAAFERVHGAWWATRSGRAQAQLNLGLLALRDGDFDGAADWYARPERGKAGAFAATGLALVRTAQGRWDEAEGLLRKAASSGAGASVQGEVDGVRVLLVLRRDGPESALSLGEHLLAPTAGGLFTGVLAVARLKSGDREGARALLGEGPPDPLMVALLPELRVL